MTTFHSVAIADGSSARPWYVADLSKDGARLQVDAGCEVPDHFTLLVKGEVVKLFKCQVVWRTSSQIGVTFAQSAGSEPGCA